MAYKVTMVALFKLVNFAAIVGVIVFLFRKYGSPVLFQQMAQEEHDVNHVQERIVALEREKNILDERIERDKHYAASLEIKIAKWAETRQQQLQEVAQASAVLQTRLRAKHHMQKEHIEQQWLANKVIPVALQYVEKELKEEYAAADKQERYMHALIQLMKQR